MDICGLEAAFRGQKGNVESIMEVETQQPVDKTNHKKVGGYPGRPMMKEGRNNHVKTITRSRRMRTERSTGFKR